MNVIHIRCIIVLLITTGKCSGIIVRSPIKPIHFEFRHQETFALSSSDNDEQEEDYDDPDPSADDDLNESQHIRKRRSAKWAPDYDLYSRWAEEYYEEYKSADLTVGAAEKPKGDILDQFLKRNQTEEELHQEKESQVIKRAKIKKAALYGSWILGLIILVCILRVYAKRLLFICGCDFCDVFHYRRKIHRVVGNFTPGVYVHKNGEKEFYPPTEEEIEALREVKKLMYSFR